MKLKLTLFLFASGLLLNSVASAAGLPDRLDLVYRGNAAGINIGTLNRQLRGQGQGIYTVTSETNASGIAALLINDIYREKSKFEVRDNIIFPLSYHQAPDKKPEKARIANFDWKQKKVSLNNGRSYDIKAGVQDPASFLFSWMLSPPKNNQAGKVSMVDGKRKSEYEFKVIGHEEVDSIWGKINTLKIERQKTGSPDKVLRMWLAVDHSYLPVVIKNIRPKYSLTFKLEKADGLTAMERGKGGG